MNDFILYWIKDGLSIIAVPVFFIISGFLLGRHVDEKRWWVTAIKSRIRSLVMPFFIINCSAFIVMQPCHYLGVRYFGANGANSRMDLTVMNFLYATGFIPWAGGNVVGLWYIKALLYLVLGSPFLVLIIRKGRLATLLFLACVVMLWSLQARIHTSDVAIASEMALTFCLRNVLFFSIGLACALYAPRSLPRFVSVMLIPLGLGALWLFKCKTFVGPCVTTAGTFIVTMLMIAMLWCVIPSQRWPKILTRNSFPLYALHMLILYVLPLSMKAIGVYDTVIRKCGFLPVFFLTILIALSIAESLKRFSPRVAGIVFGGR